MTVIDSDKNKVLCLGAINLDPEIKNYFIKIQAFVF